MLDSPSVIAPVPEFARWINPVLRALGELGGSARPREVVERVALNEQVSDDVLDLLNPSGGQRFANQVHWARFFLADAGFIDRSKRGVWKLTEVANAAGQLILGLVELVRGVQERSRNIHQSQRRQPTSPVHRCRLAPQLSSLAGDISSEAPPPDHEDGDSSPDCQSSSIIDLLDSNGCASDFTRSWVRASSGDRKSNDGGIDGHGVLSVNHFVSFRVLFQCKRYRNGCAGASSRLQRRDARACDRGSFSRQDLLPRRPNVRLRGTARHQLRLLTARVDRTVCEVEPGLRPITTYEVVNHFAGTCSGRINKNVSGTI